MDIRTLMMSLFSIYGKNSAKKNRGKYENVATISYNIMELIDTIFNVVDNLREIVDLANHPYVNM